MPRCSRCSSPASPTLLIANKLDPASTAARDIAPWLRDMQERHPFTEFVPMSAKKRDDIQRLLGICAPYLPQQPWFYGADELTDRSEKFLASETVREKLFRFTGDELPYTSTVVIDKFDEEPSPSLAASCALPPPSSSSATGTRPWSLALAASA